MDEPSASQSTSDPMHVDRANSEDTESGDERPTSAADTKASVSWREEKMQRKNRTLAEFLVTMNDYTPIIPDAVTDYYLGRAGFDCDDVRIKRLLALAAQKFIADIATDAYQHSKIRAQSSKERRYGKDRKTVLTMDDLAASLAEYGVNLGAKPEYYT
ncbi:uncharacterized protein VTP21DRAFT_1620 [Calcarisporiella thermophila]|uniref:uncharacterized protein n=1 Tax=Calcarisporiella thermophila TaxID=911321 RepID=UPI0037433EDF